MGLTKVWKQESLPKKRCPGASGARKGVFAVVSQCNYLRHQRAALVLRTQGSDRGIILAGLDGLKKKHAEQLEFELKLEI